MGPTRKGCSELGCNKLAASGGLCVGHGGGKLCQFPGCSKGYQRGGFCRNHGGGSRCTVPFCKKVDAGHGLCRSHGGGKRCKVPECSKADVGGGFCTAHGGGKRCGFPTCDKNSQGGGFCRAHGGGRRCTAPDCTKMGRGASGMCPEHGGSPVCNAPNCRRLARDGQGRCRDHSHVHHDESEVLSQHSDDSSNVAPRSDRLAAAASSEEDAMVHEAVITLPPPSVAYVYRRLLVQVQLQDPWTDHRVLALLRSEPAVRSVHILGYRHNASTKQRQPKASVCFVVRGGVSERALDAAMAGLPVRCTVLEDSLVEDLDTLVTVETTLDVHGMMCVANCGNTVVRAIQSVPSVLEVHLAFDQAQVVVRSSNAVTAHKLIARVQAIGFEANLVSVHPVPWHRQFKMHGAGDRRVTMESAAQLEAALRHVEGVEQVVALPHLQMVEVTGFYNATEVSLVAATVAMQLTEVSPPSPDRNERSAAAAPPVQPAKPPHACSFACSATGCVKYQTTMAHTAALAVGWAVPGCGMSFGLECNCGDACKCAGCPTHNPGNLDPVASLL